ncbi:MAG: bifunctional glutamate N-acetyltransferase/amino-acid acetyltransferase ArgJ [Thermodesulfovibrionales bacterium]|nr:bifunctional glutamate N-acetyltransferase/amino-acid acetyltransferase ArgJ [Thermodesulfovibrionales bacterium]
MPEKTPDIPLPLGFLFSTAEAAIKKPAKGSKRKDMALIYSEADAVCSAAFTTNKVKGAPVKLGIERIKSGKARAVVINSGNSNVSTGKRGMGDAREMAALAARHLGIPEHLVHVSSTGVIGVPLPMQRIRPRIAEMARSIGSASALDAAGAIMTTDTFPKVAARRLKIGGRTGTILGICKGAGMIAPKMATMLCFIMTDIAVKRSALDRAFKEAVGCSFNRITIDGDMSTSDTAIVMANGMLGNKEITASSSHYSRFKKALSGLAYELSKMIARDGEGATKLIEVEVRGARTEADALRGAFTIANSLLVKTAVYGNDANWGRIMAALGRAGIDMSEEKTDIYFGKVRIVSRGVSTGKYDKAGEALRQKEVKITADLNMGRHKASVLTCDITEGYIRVNAEYRT